MVRRLAPALVAAVVLAACGSGVSDDSTTETAPTTPATSDLAASGPETTDAGSAVLPDDVPDALRFSAPLLDGGDIELTTLAGRPVLLWFWAPW